MEIWIKRKSASVTLDIALNTEKRIERIRLCTMRLIRTKESPRPMRTMKPIRECI